MTRKDFQLIADVLRDLDANVGAFHPGYAREAATAFANALATTNPRFDRQRFLAAALGTD